MYLISEDFNPYTKNNIYEVFIPRGLTPVCQPLDININKIFKDEMKKLYLNWIANLINNQTRVTRQNVVEWYKMDLNQMLNSILGTNVQCSNITYFWLNNRMLL